MPCCVCIATNYDSTFGLMTVCIWVLGRGHEKDPVCSVCELPKDILEALKHEDTITTVSLEPDEWRDDFVSSKVVI